MFKQREVIVQCGGTNIIPSTDQVDDHRVPATNNESERLLRRYKRKQQQAVSFRGFESIEYLCQGMSMLIQIRQNEDPNLYNRVSQIFG